MSPWRRRVKLASRRAQFYPILAITAAVGFIIGTISFFAVVFSNSNKAVVLPFTQTVSLLIGTLVPAMALLVLLGRWVALRRVQQGVAGNNSLHVQLVFLFSLVSAVPTLLVVIFASWLFQSGVEFWFSDSSRGMLENANRLARGYYEQSQRDVSQETVAMASDLKIILAQSSLVSRQFAENFSYQVVQRNLDQVAIIQKVPDGSLRISASVNPKNNDLRARIRPEELQSIARGQPIVVKPSADRIEALTAIDRRAGILLYAARSSDLLALSQGQSAENIVRAYRELSQRARLLQLRFNLALFIISLTLVGTSVWFALRFADRQVKPLFDLVDGARRVGSGNFSLRVDGRSGADEIGLLNRAFNRMTVQLEQQTQALVGANYQLDERRAFIEAVLESITAGIISLDGTGAVLLINSSAQKMLLGKDATSPVGESLETMAPQLAAMVASGRADGLVQHGKEGDLLTLAVKVSSDQSGHVITFEDITRQLLDQRAAAWSDVARRIAHEIKNPLTPIQLATERLTRRYRKQISDQPELFEELTSTIIRQVGELRKMVDEFSSFARLPKPVFRTEDPVDLARQALFLQGVARPDIDFSFTAPDDIGVIACDRHQFGQSMTNVIKNAIEAIESKVKIEKDSYRGQVVLGLVNAPDWVDITITDNGIGLPQDRERIVEPYVTTREKGTGLGLAIVKKILEEHGGDMNFASVPGGGTMVSLRFARDPLSRDPLAEAAE